MHKYTGTIFDQQVLGLGTPASNAGLKAGDVLVQVTVQTKEKKTTFTFAITTFDKLDYSCPEVYFASQVDVVVGGEQNCHNAHPSRGGPVYQGGP